MVRENDLLEKNMKLFNSDNYGPEQIRSMLKSYKDMIAEGLINEEDYNIKKKQVLEKYVLSANFLHEEDTQKESEDDKAIWQNGNNKENVGNAVNDGISFNYQTLTNTDYSEMNKKHKQSIGWIIAFGALICVIIPIFLYVWGSFQNYKTAYYSLKTKYEILVESQSDNH